MLLSSLFLAASFCFNRVAAHGGVLSYNIGGTYYDGWKAYNSPTGQTTIQRPWDTYNPIQDPTSRTLACNNDGAAGALQLTAAPVRAGSSIVAYWNQVWPHDTGPVIVYLSKCPGSCTSVNAVSAQWFKIEQAGLLSGTVAAGQWAAGKLITSNNSWTTVIPSGVPSGQYLIRFETIALHSMPAQFYPECAQIEITGGGDVAPSASQLVTFPGGYKASDPGVTIDLYGTAAKTQTTYVIPGPPLYNGTPSSSSTTATPTVTPTPTQTPTPTPTSSTTAAPTQTGVVPQYGQCGGQGYTGATACIAPFVCKVLNAFYSQCT